MQRFCDTAIQEIPNIRSLVDSFIQAWNIMVSSTNSESLLIVISVSNADDIIRIAYFLHSLVYTIY